MFRIKSICEPAGEEDGFRIFVEKLWPEGLPYNDAEVDLWLKEIAPAIGVDEWVTEDSADFDEFKKSYRCELRNSKTLLKIIRNFEKEHKIVTLLYSVGEPECNCAVVLRDKLSGYRVIGTSVGRIHGG